MPCFICYQAAMDSSTPSTAGSPCRDRTGRFASGNRIGKGNPFARRTAEFHSALLDAVEPRMVEALAKRMVKAALEGDVAAAKLVLVTVPPTTSGFAISRREDRRDGKSRGTAAADDPSSRAA